MSNENLFINIYNYKNENYPFQIFIGARGCGKTFSALDGATNPEPKNHYVDGKFIFMRRTGKELSFLLDSDKKGEGMNPFKPINKKNKTNIGLRAINENLAGVYNREVSEEGKYLYNDMIGFATSLSSVASIRGLSVEDATDIIYDEFIPEKHVKAIGKDGAEFEALMNAYESFNRNRELEGKPPMNLWLLSNANNIYNEIFVGLGIVDLCEKMIREGKSDKYIKSRGLAIHILPDSTEYTKQKSNTALYRLTRGTNFEEMALHNNFAYNDFSLITYRDLKGYQPVCQIDDIYVYKKKGSKEYYCCRAKAKCPAFNTAHENERRAFMRKYGMFLLNRFTNSELVFETFDIKARVLDLIA